MDDNWGNDEESGKAFGRGRPIEADDDGWGETNGAGNDVANEWGDNSRPPRGGGRSDRGERRGGRGGGRGRGGSRGGGGRSDSNGYQSKRNNDGGGWGGGDTNDNGWNGGNNENSEGGWGGGYSENNGDWGERRGGRGGGRGGRGSRGGGRSGESRGDGDFGRNNDEKEKPRERYIPPEPSTEESEIFSSVYETGINFDKYDEIEVKVSGENIPSAISNFKESGLRPFLLANVEKSKYTKPTPIQKYAIPFIMDGRDLMACAQTGSGKTASYLLPILHTLLNDPKDLVFDATHCEPQAIILSPTRELAIQIHDECRKFSHQSILRVVVAYGGVPAYHHAKQLLVGCHILVATPGRLLDFVENGKVTFNSIRFFVLDEADRMLDMGFLPNVEKVLNHETMVSTTDRQTLMFSATFPVEIQTLAGKFLNNYLFITVGIVGGACSDVTQIFYQVDKYNKREKLLEIFKEEGAERTIVFVETKRNADFLASILCSKDFKTTSIHGDRLQRERELALGDFKYGRRDILVATGVAARGLDIKDVKHVINYDLPNGTTGIDEYVHRIGRTGRVGNRGKATSFYDSSQDAALAKDLIKILRQANQPIPDWLQRDENASGGSSFRNSKFGGRDVRGDNFGAPQDNFASSEPAELEEW